MLKYLSLDHCDLYEFGPLILVFSLCLLTTSLLQAAHQDRDVSQLPVLALVSLVLLLETLPVPMLPQADFGQIQICETVPACDGKSLPNLYRGSKLVDSDLNLLVQHLNLR